MKITKEVVKKCHEKNVENYIPQAGDWFLITVTGSTEPFPVHKYFCIGRSNSGAVVYENSNGTMYSVSTDGYMFKKSFLSPEEEWKIQANALVESVSEPKDVIHQIYQALVSRKLPIPK